MARTKAVVELTLEQQIAQIRKEAADKIKALETSLPWDKRFTNAFNKFIKNNRNNIAVDLNGHKIDIGIESEINCYLNDVNLSIKYESATFDNELYYNTTTTVDSFDLSEYPVYTIFAVLENKEVIGYVKINCQYSSYNGNEYNGFSFVQPRVITCKVFTTYEP